MAPRRIRTTVLPSPCGTTAPPNCGAGKFSKSSRLSFLLFCPRPLPLPFPPLPNAPAAPPRCGGRPPPFPPNGEPDGDADGERYGEFDVPPGRVDEGAPEFGLASLDGGRAAKPGLTEPGRAPDIGGRCPGCNFPGVLPASPGRIGLAGGRGPPPPVLNGLLPALGGRGIALGVLGASGVAEKGLLVLLGAAGVVGRATGVASSIICCNSGGKSSTLTVCFGAAFFAGAFLAFGAASAGTKSGNLSINLRTTGASTVDDAERTNSPTSCSLDKSSLLSSPNSFANS